MTIFRCALICSLLLLGWVSRSPGQETQPTTAPSFPELDRLKELVPETLADLKRTTLNTQKVSMGESAMFIVEASFAKEDDDAASAPAADLTICDYGNNSPMAQAAAPWSQSQFSREAGGETEKTTKVQGLPALETYDRDDKKGSVMVYVAGRYLVTLTGSNLPADKMHAEAEKLPLKKLSEPR